MKKIFIIIFTLILSINSTFAIETLTQTYGENNKFGLIKDNKKITEPIYKKLIRLGDNSWLFLKGSKYGIISNTGEILVEPKYTSAYRFSGGRFAKMGLRGKYALFNEYGQAISYYEEQNGNKVKFSDKVINNKGRGMSVKF